MSKIIDILKAIWTELDSVIELFIYLGIAYVITKAFGLTYIQAIALVFIYFTLSLLRLLVETFRNKNR